MPLTPEYQIFVQFLTEIFNDQKNESQPDIKLKSTEINIASIREKLPVALKDHIIEIIEVDNTKNQLVKKSNSDENISIIEDSIDGDIGEKLPLVIVKTELDSADGQVYRVKKGTVNQSEPILEYVGKRKLPKLITKQLSSNIANDEIPEYEEESENNHNVAIKQDGQTLLQLAFDDSGTCYLLTDNKTRKAVGAKVSDLRACKNFVAKHCRKDKSLTIVINEQGEIIKAYTREGTKEKNVEIDEKLKPQIERVIAAAFNLQQSIVKSVPPANTFPKNEINDPKTIPNNPLPAPVKANTNS